MKNKAMRAFIIVMILTLIPIDSLYAMESEVSVEENNEVVNPPTTETETSQTVNETENFTMSSDVTQELPVTDSMNDTTEREELLTGTTDTTVPLSGEIMQTAVQDVEGFWPVDSAATLRTYLTDNQKLKFRLTTDIDLGSAVYELKNGMIIDGAGHTITYNKGSSPVQGFYANQQNATIEIRNTQFGRLDGTGATGYYGILTGLSAVNMTFIFDTITYHSTNGQMIYNLNGNIVMRGINTIDQRGTGPYSQEWAETNRVEIQTGTTTIKHSSNQTLGFIWSQSTAAGNPYANTSQLVVKENAHLDVQTNASMTYGTLSPSYVVEKNGSFKLDKVTLATGDDRDKFFYNNQTQKIMFDFKDNSNVNFILPFSINNGFASGGFFVGKDAIVSVDIHKNTALGVFSTEESSQFQVKLTNPKQVTFSSTIISTLLLNSTNDSRFGNLAFQHSDGLRVETYTNKLNTVPSSTFYKKDVTLNVRAIEYRNTPQSVEPLSPTELNALGMARKIVFRGIKEPTDVTVSVGDVTATSASLYANSHNNGSKALGVKYLLFSSLADTSNVTKAHHIYHVENLGGNNTEEESNYQGVVNSLNPNTTYWVQAVVTNSVGQSQMSAPHQFSTLPELGEITPLTIGVSAATIEGGLLSDTGKWTDFTNGESNPVINKPVTYGGIYERVEIEYSPENTFPIETTQSISATLSGNKNQLFSATLTNLLGGTTYYVRVRATGVSTVETTLTLSPLSSFTTLEEIINVEVPIEMMFETQNQDIGTNQAGQLHSSNYSLVNKGNVPVKISLTGLTKENGAAERLQLLPTLAGPVDSDALSLQLIINGDTSTAPFITDQVSATPIEVGRLETEGSASQKVIRFGGTYFNPNKSAIYPTYKALFKVEKN